MKTTFFKSMKLFMFLLLAVLSSFIGIAQTTQPHVIINPIGGGRTPDTDALINPHPILNMPNICSVFDIGGRQDVPTMPCEYEILGRDSTRGMESYASIECQNFNYDIGGTFTTGALTGNSTLAIGGNRPPVGELIKSNAIGGKSQEPALHIVISNYGRIPILGVYS